MTTKNFTEGAETLNKNVNDAMKWFQDTTSAIMETQSKQLEYANDMYSQMVNNYLGEIKKDNFNNSFDTSKTIMEFGKQTDSKDVLKTMTETFSKQIDTITNVNKNTFDTLSKQFNVSKTAFE